ncbi:carboxylate--amine ligase [Streptomyces sp. NBC_01429]|uniref:carboxylate--amine ligase n=1 Tax=Streptomyces sp. NBC_01429 TaxID=2903862 RepID=UPI002E282FB9|nr:ATP-grasp domain-containing protein [Streptomyces sp. NBC_01429]
MPSYDTRVPAVLMRLDRNPFHHGTLGAVRSLGRAGIEVHAVIEAERSPVVRSRYLRRAHLRPGGERDLTGSPDLTASPYLTGLPDLAETGRLLLDIAGTLHAPAVLVPMDDLSAIAVDRLGDRLAGRYLLPEQPSGLPERVADKAELARICAELGIAHPRTVVPGCAKEAAAAAWSLGLPVVAKWSRPWLLPEGSGLRSTRVVRSPQEARELYARGAEAGSALLLQEFLPYGRDLDWFFHGYSGGPGGTCLVGAAGRKERAWPVGAGLTAVGSWLPNEEVERTARQIVAALGYRGILDLDFRRDAATGAYHLLDFNPRPGAQFRLFADRAGVDVVRALHLDLTGRAVPAQVAAHGRRFVVENYALLSVLSSARSSSPDAPASPDSPDDDRHPGRRRPLGAGPRSTEAAWFALDDPLPACAMAVAWVLHAARRGWRGLRRALPSRRRPGHAGRSRTPPVRQRRGSRNGAAPGAAPVPRRTR